MIEPARTAPRIDNPKFRKAVELIDGGRVHELRQWISDNPELLTATAEEDGSFAGDYFARPRLIWFVANAHGTLPGI